MIGIRGMRRGRPPGVSSPCALVPPLLLVALRLRLTPVRAHIPLRPPLLRDVTLPLPPSSSRENLPTAQSWRKNPPPPPLSLPFPPWQPAEESFFLHLLQRSIFLPGVIALPTAPSPPSYGRAGQLPPPPSLCPPFAAREAVRTALLLRAPGRRNDCCACLVHNPHTRAHMKREEEEAPARYPGTSSSLSTALLPFAQESSPPPPPTPLRKTRHCAGCVYGVRKGPAPSSFPGVRRVIVVSRKTKNSPLPPLGDQTGSPPSSSIVVVQTWTDLGRGRKEGNPLLLPNLLCGWS